MDPDRRKKVLILASAFCLAAFAADTFVLSPLVAAWQTRSDRIAQLRQDIEKSDAVLEREKTLEERWTDMNQRALSTRVSDAENVVFQSLNEWAAASSLTINSIKPRWTQIAKNEPVLEVQIDASGAIYSVARFLWQLESGLLPLRVEDFAIVSKDQSGSTLNMSLRVTGLVLKDKS